MPRLKEKFVVNAKGKRTSVILNMEEYRRILDDLEELECIRAYDEAKESKDEVIPFEQAMEEIERNHK